MKTLTDKDKTFTWTHVIKRFEIQIRQYNTVYLLFIEGQDFSYLMNSQKEADERNKAGKINKSPSKSPTKEKEL